MLGRRMQFLLLLYHLAEELVSPIPDLSLRLRLAAFLLLFPLLVVILLTFGFLFLALEFPLKLAVSPLRYYQRGVKPSIGSGHPLIPVTLPVILHVKDF